MKKFPNHFLWGAATSAYQVEGDNRNSDWWPWEKAAGKEQSGQACRHYELYQQDFKLAKELGHNAHRLSIEWARIEPEDGRFSDKELQHYVQVIQALRSSGLEPVVTLHHFTNPVWISRIGGWENPRAIVRFRRYCDYVVRALSKQVRYWITINEPTILFSHAYLFGVWPPQVKSARRAWAVHDHLMAAHIEAYRRIHRIYAENSLPSPAVGFSHHMTAVVPCRPDLRNRLAARLRNFAYNLDVLNIAARAKSMDFIGLNYYSRNLVDVTSWRPQAILMQTCSQEHHPLKKNSLGWDVYPEGLYQLLKELQRYALPVMVTENGICTADDNQRWDFIAAHLASMHRATQEGVNVAGYLYWSLLDNFEWDKGFGPRFGLIDVNYRTFERTIRPSARKFAEVCQTGVLR